MKARALHLRLSAALLAGSALAAATALSGGRSDGAPDPCVDGGTVDAAQCGYDIGECKAGVLSCEGGYLHCAWLVPPAEEVCNGKDDDCNGLVDDAPHLNGSPCTSAPDDDAGSRMHGQCLGTSRCVDGGQSCVRCDDGGTSCVPVALPSIEVCDGEDNDCDGVVDNDNGENGFPLCFGGMKCISGENIPAQCALPCDHGELSGCPQGFACVTIGEGADSARFCVATGAIGAPCTESRLCQSGFCVDGVCCDQACGGCMACKATLKGPSGGGDGTCGPIGARPPDDRCAPCTSTFQCPVDHVCNEQGQCVAPVEADALPSCAAGRAGGAGVLSALVIASLLAARRRRDQGGAQTKVS